MIKAVLFDIDGVLLDSFEANRQFYHKLFVWAGYKPPTLQQYVPLQHFTLKKIVKEYTKASDKEVLRIWKYGQENLLRLYPYELLRLPLHMKDTIQDLYKSYLLGVVTSRLNGFIFSMRPLTSFEKYFKIIVGAENTIKHKPHPDPLLFASKELGVNPDEMVYVGDAESDVLAARAAGMKVILFAKENFADADAYTASFKELPEKIAAL